MGAVIVALRRGDHKALEDIAARWGCPVKDAAGILLEGSIRREMQVGAGGDMPPVQDDWHKGVAVGFTFDPSQYTGRKG